MNKKVLIDTPLWEITLRRYERPINLTKRNLVKKLCLSVGLLQPGDSRDVIVDVMYVMLEARQSAEMLSSEDVRKRVIELRKEEKIILNGIAGSNIRRQLKRLRDMQLVEKVKNDYRITELSNISQTFEEKVIKYLLPSVIDRVKEYYVRVDSEFKPTDDKPKELHPKMKMGAG